MKSCGKLKKKLIFPSWFSDFPAWERAELKRHYDSSRGVVKTSFIPSPLKPDDIFSRRQAGEPLEYILGHCHVDDITIKITPDVLIPRQETETMVRLFSEHISALPPGPIIDCGTGSGFIATWLSKKINRFVIAVDNSLPAIRVALDNRSINSSNFSLLAGDLLGSLSCRPAAVLANLPYVKQKQDLEDSVRNFEPRQSLVPPASPHRLYRRLLKQARIKLKTGGELWLEGTGDLFKKLLPTVNNQNWKNYEILTDLSDRDRFMRLFL